MRTSSDLWKQGKSQVGVAAGPSSQDLAARNREFPEQESRPEYPTDEDTISTSGLHLNTHVHTCSPPHTHMVSDEGEIVQFFNFSNMYIKKQF